MAYIDSQKRQHINEIQTYLHAISFMNGNIPRVTPNGMFNNETIIAVRAFQREYNLKETGNIDPVTWNKIVSVYRSYININPIPYNAFPSERYIARIGDSGQIIYILQAMLVDISNNYDNAPNISVTGEYDKATSDMVKFFQKKTGLSQSGNVDSITWNMLVIYCEHINNILFKNKNNT